MSSTGTPEAADEARLLLEVLPIAKSWPSEWCLRPTAWPSDPGGYGYTRDFPVEQYWRDNRLNMIHEGTHGIQAMDLLGRKVLMEGGKGLALLAGASTTPCSAPAGAARGRTCQRIGWRLAAGGCRHQRPPGPRASPVMHWHECRALHAGIWPHGAGMGVAGFGWQRWQRRCHWHNRPAWAAWVPCSFFFFFHYELPKIGAWLQVVSTRDATCAQMPEDAFWAPSTARGARNARRIAQATRLCRPASPQCAAPYRKGSCHERCGARP